MVTHDVAALEALEAGVAGRRHVPKLDQAVGILEDVAHDLVGRDLRKVHAAELARAGGVAAALLVFRSLALLLGEVDLVAVARVGALAEY